MNISPPPPGSKPVPNPCPCCKTPALHIETRMVAKPLGSFSLAGQAMKVSATECAYLVCRMCGCECEGAIEQGGTHARFDPEAMKVPTPDPSTE